MCPSPMLFVTVRGGRGFIIASAADCLGGIKHESDSDFFIIDSRLVE